MATRRVGNCRLLKGASSYMNVAMLKNYVTVAVRNLMRHRVYSVINVVGLAIGMATCILIMRYIQDELSVDGWHTRGDRIYRVIRETLQREKQRSHQNRTRMPSGSGWPS